MKPLQLCAAALLLSACVTDAPDSLVLPGAQTVDGVRVQLTRVRRSHTRYFGLAGEAVNLGATRVSRLSVLYEVLDGQGANIGRARAERTDLAPGEVWEFEAEFSTAGVTAMGSVLPGRIKVFR